MIFRPIVKTFEHHQTEISTHSTNGPLSAHVGLISGHGVNHIPAHVGLISAHGSDNVEITAGNKDAEWFV